MAENTYASEWNVPSMPEPMNGSRCRSGNVQALYMLRLLPAIFLIPLYASNWAEAQSDRNLALNQPVTASATLVGSSPAYAVDGEASTYWSAGASPIQSVEVTLPQDSVVSAVRLKLVQQPAGRSVHDITLITSFGEEVPFSHLDAYTYDGQTIELYRGHPGYSGGATPPYQTGSVSRVRIVTSTSPSWVAWREIEVWGHTAEYVQQSKSQLLGPATYSQYSPWVVPIPGGYSMFVCRNVPLDYYLDARRNRDRVHRYISLDGVNWYGETVVSAADGNVQMNKSYWASSTLEGSTVQAAFDGNPATLWNSGNPGTATIDVDLGDEYVIDNMTLLTAQTPDGWTYHRIYMFPPEPFWGPDSNYIAAEFSGNTVDNQSLYFDATHSYLADGVRYIRIQTLASPSWVAWREIAISGVRKNDPEGLSCTAGVVPDFMGAWHMYYVTASLAHGDQTHLFHSVSYDAGTTWQKTGEVSLPPDFSQNFALENPSPHVVDGRISLFMSGPGNGLYRAWSSIGWCPSGPGHCFETPSLVDSRGGRVSRVGDRFLNLISDNPFSAYDIGVQFLVEKSTGNCSFNSSCSFGSPAFLFSATPGSFDSWRTFNGSILSGSGPDLAVYYGGNSYSCSCCGCWPGSYTSIGLRRFLPSNP